MDAKFVRTPALKEAYAKATNTINGRLDGHYQHDGLRWMLHRELNNGDYPQGGILADDMGLGKTMQAIALLRGNPMPTLVVSIVATVVQWRDALINFGNFKPVIINSSFQGMLPIDTELAITTYSSFQGKNVPQCLMTHQWGRIILDEGHAIRNASTKVFKELSKVKAKSRWILSGTPIQNSPKDMLNLGLWIGVEGMPLEEFINVYVLRRTQEQQETINPRLALPPLTTTVVNIEFQSPEERTFYNDIERYFSNKLNSTSDAIEALMRCRQACTHPRIYDEGIAKKTKKSGIKRRRLVLSDDEEEDDIPRAGVLVGYVSSKVKFLINSLKASKGKSLVFCMWTLEMKIIQNALKNEGISAMIYDGGISRDNKEAVLYNFKNTSIPVLIIQINCGSSGLNLQCANMVYIMSPNWNPCIELQAIGRAYRKGQTQQVTCLRLVMNNTVEEKCIKIQERKMNIISEALMDESYSKRLGSCDKELTLNDIKSVFSCRADETEDDDPYTF